MGFNYGFEKRKFDRVWEKLHREYIEAGMDETAILSMYEFDCSLAAGLPKYEAEMAALDIACII